jgi:hypothetical protein
MLRILFCAILGALAVATGGAQGTAPPKKAPTANKKPVASSRPASSKTPSSSRNTSRRSAPAPRTTWRNRQTAPAPERYKEIQDALVAKGYLRPEDANGSWSPASTEALKKFQSEQNLDSSGKINSLSLIALGLGPKREGAPAKPPAPPPPAQELPTPGR